MDLTQSFSKGDKQYERIGLYFKYVTQNSSISIQISKEAVILVAGTDFAIASTMEQTAQNYVDALRAVLIASDNLQYYSLNRVFDVARIKSLRSGITYDFAPEIVNELDIVSTFEGAIIDEAQNIIDYPEIANDDGTLVVDFYPAGALDMALLQINGVDKQVTSSTGSNTDFPAFELNDYSSAIGAYFPPNFGLDNYIEAHNNYLEHQFVGLDRELYGGETAMPNRLAEFESETGIIGLDMPYTLEIDIIDGEGNPAVYSSYYPQRLYTEVKNGDAINLKVVGGINFIKTGYSFRTRLVKNVVNDIRVLKLDIDSYVNYDNWNVEGLKDDVDRIVRAFDYVTVGNAIDTPDADYETIALALADGKRILNLISDVTETNKWESTSTEISITSIGVVRDINLTTDINYTTLGVLKKINTDNIKFNVFNEVYDAFESVIFYMSGECYIVGSTSLENKFGDGIINRPVIKYAEDLTVDGGTANGCKVNIGSAKRLEVTGTSGTYSSAMQIRFEEYGVIDYLKIGSSQNVYLHEGSVNFIESEGTLTVHDSNCNVRNGSIYTFTIVQGAGDLSNLDINRLSISSSPSASGVMSNCKIIDNIYPSTIEFPAKKFEGCSFESGQDITFSINDAIIENCTFDSTLTNSGDSNTFTSCKANEIENAPLASNNTFDNCTSETDMRIDGNDNTIDKCKSGTLEIAPTAEDTIVTSCRTLSPIVDTGIGTFLSNNKPL